MPVSLIKSTANRVCHSIGWRFPSAKHNIEKIFFKNYPQLDKIFLTLNRVLVWTLVASIL